MYRFGALLLFLSAATLSGAPCVPSSTRLCLNGGRFAAEVSWKDFQGNTGVGEAIPLTGDTGYFWFFSSSNVELVVKVVDGRALNSKYWVFYGALSNVEYTMTVTDSLTGSVKTYVNPSGNFGSVGDTSAFGEAGAAVSSRRVSQDDIRELTASSELALREALLAPHPLDSGSPSDVSKAPVRTRSATPPTGACTPTDTSLCLNDNRFRVTVNWTDFEGNTGVGTAVGLTGDTGYFWFFSSNNIELTVKALDARVLNGHFWVFYGALSNVQYEMTVTDTLTGNAATYTNPSGRFASLGDTAAFSAGYSVTPELDASRAVSGEITTAGGTLTTTGADGTVFTLTIPPDALLSDETLTMTPVTAVHGLPLSGGLTGAVQLAPAGLRLYQLVALTISPPVPIPEAGRITFGWRGEGDEFFLQLPLPGAAGITMRVMHFGGYGVGRGNSADEAAQQARVPASSEDALSQRLQGIHFAKSGASSSGARRVQAEDSDSDELLALYVEYQKYYEALLPELEAAKTDCPTLKAVSTRALSWVRQVELLYGDSFADEIHQIILALVDGVVNCYDKAFVRCVDKHDPTQIYTMLSAFRTLAVYDSEDRVDYSKITRCVSFELDFESVYEEIEPWRHHVRTTIPMEYVLGGGLSGSADLAYDPSYTGEDVSPCAETTTGTKSVFEVIKTTLNLNTFEGDTPPPLELTLTYDPGHPFFSFNLTCSDPPVNTKVEGDRWRGLYDEAHSGERSGSAIVARDWSRVGGSIYARKTYSTTREDGTETTIMDLRHTPH